MPADLTIRSVARTDFAQWEPLWEGYNTFYERTVPANITQMAWSRFFDAYEPVHAVVAEKSGRLVGVVHYLFHRNTTMLGPVCYLQDLFTSEAERGKGVGRALIECVYERARAAGSPRVYWMTQETNTTARKLYDKVAVNSGFIQYRKDL